MNSSPPPLKQARDGCNTKEKLKTILIKSFLGGGVRAYRRSIMGNMKVTNLIDSLFKFNPLNTDTIILVQRTVDLAFSNRQRLLYRMRNTMSFTLR